MEKFMIGSAIIIHLLIFALLWRKIYRKIPKQRARLNLSIWAIIVIIIAYAAISINSCDAIDSKILDELLLSPCLYIGFSIPYLVYPNLCYSVVLLIQKWVSIPSDKKNM